MTLLPLRQPLIKSYIYYDNKSLAGNNENISARHGWKIPCCCI